MQTALVGHTRTIFGILPYLYPPYFALAIVPLAALPYGVAYVAWLAFDCLLLSGSMFAMERYAGLSRRQRIAFRFLTITFLPVFLALLLGQVSLVLLALLTACVTLAAAGRYEWAGVALGLAVMKPVYVVPALLVALLYGRWRMLAAFGATVVVALAAALPFAGMQIYGSYLRILRETSSWQGGRIHHPLWYHGQPVAPSTYQPIWNHSFAGFAELLGVSWWVVVAAVLCLGAVVAVAWTSAMRPPIDLALAAAIPAGLLISPHTLAYDLCLLLIPASALVRYRAGERARVAGTLVLGYVAVTAGYVAVFFLHIQFSILAGCLALISLALTAWRIRTRHFRDAGTVRTFAPAHTSP
jgi:hypothetical protein